MMIGEVMEYLPTVLSMENMADRLADRVRNIWLDRIGKGTRRWEETFFEDPDGVAFLAQESFPHLVGMDYIFRWWGEDNKEAEELGGELLVIWKSDSGDGMKLYKTTIRFAERDFILGLCKTEDEKREANREQFRKAFRIWQKLYLSGR